MTLAAFEKNLAGFGVEIHGREAELDRRVAAAKKAEAENELTAVAARVEV